MNTNYNPDRKWIIEVTEEELYDIIEDVEDIHRFLSGQMELRNATRHIPMRNIGTIRCYLRELQPMVTPGLSHGEYYDWAGTHCPDMAQRRKIRRGYAIYRNLRHCIELFRHSVRDSVYKSETLTCDESLAVCYPIMPEDEKY